MLSDREKEILSRATFSNRQIACLMNLSTKTIERYFADMFAKTHTARRTELLLKAIEAGEIKRVDMGFWDKDGNYTPDWQIVDMRKE
jgi:DNA-binding NarL/FixJ family response regulator